MNEPGAKPICPRCGALMMLANELPRLGPRAPAIRVYVCTECGAHKSVEWSGSGSALAWPAVAMGGVPGPPTPCGWTRARNGRVSRHNGARTMSIVQIEKRGKNVSVIFNLRTPQEATGFAELIASQLKDGELHLQLGSKPRLVIDVPQCLADPSHPPKKSPPDGGEEGG